MPHYRKHKVGAHEFIATNIELQAHPPDGRPHPSEHLIDAFSMNRLCEEDAAAVEEHVLGCPICLRVCEEKEEISAALWLAGYAPHRAKNFERAGDMFQPHVFLSHGRPCMEHVRSVAALLLALKLNPVIVEDKPNLGLSIHQKVRKYVKMCRAAVVFATSDEKNRGTRTRTRPNIDHEIGMLQSTPEIGGRIVFMKEPAVHAASNYAEKVWIEFLKERIQDSFVPLIRELNAFAL